MANFHVIFLDIRGFTKWLTSNDTTTDAAKILVQEMYADVEELFGPAKFLGDGALIVLPSTADNRQDLGTELEELLDKINLFSARFAKHKDEVSFRCACNCFELELGFGITRDPHILIVRSANDSQPPEYVGTRIALAERLCSIARPHGIVIHKNSFHSIPEKYTDEFRLKKTAQLKGFNEENDIWASSSIRSIETAEVHVSGLLFQSSKVLLSKRPGAEETTIYPNYWAAPGGRVRFTKSFENSLKSIYEDEVGIYITNLEIIGTYYNKNHHIPGLMYRCALDSGVLNESDSVRFFSAHEIERHDFLLIPDLRRTILNILQGQ
ncbi:MAG: hypothetical protein ACYCYR_10690 [Desulfobulbaceae bacterium]